MRVNGKQFLRIDRVCPRCHVHRLHHANMNEATHAVSICCAECGHTWAGRYKKDEWHDVPSPVFAVEVDEDADTVCEPTPLEARDFPKGSRQNP